MFQIDFTDAAPSGVSREEGSAARKWLNGLVAIHGAIEIRLDNVDMMTPSFADECFGKLLREMGETAFRSKVHLSGGDRTLRGLINQILRIRLSELRSASPQRR